MAENSETANLADSFYTVHYSTDGQTFKKIPALQEADVPSEEAVLDEVTTTDSKRKIEVPVDFVEDGEWSFTYAHDESNADHKALQKAYKDKSELTFQIKFPTAPTLNCEFKGIISALNIKAEVKKKIRREAKVSITSNISNSLTGG